MKIVIFGANGATGKILTKQALDSGYTVTAVTRYPEAFPLRDVRLNVMGGDVFDLALVEQAVAGQDAVLSTLGVPFSRKPITIYSRGMAHIVQAMKHSGVHRVVCVSSSATGTNHDTGGGFIFDKILQPIVISTIGQTTYADMKQMETLLSTNGTKNNAKKFTLLLGSLETIPRVARRSRAPLRNEKRREDLDR